MHRSSIIILLLLIFFISMGILLMFAPGKVYQIQKSISQTFGLMQGNLTPKILDPKKLIFSRMIGVLYISLSLFLLWNMNFQTGQFSSTQAPFQSILKISQSSHESNRLHQTVHEIVKPHINNYTGMVIGTIADGVQDLTGFGRVNLNSDIPPDGETIFEIGSISKVFTGILLADQIIKQKVTLETPMISLIPSIPTLKGSKPEQITMTHLATHTSGLKRLPGHIFSPFQIWRLVAAKDYYKHYTRDDLIVAATKMKFRYRPGEKYAYSNVGFGLLGMALADMNKSKYHDLVKTVIADPLGLKDTCVLLNNTQEARMAKGYRTFLHMGRFFLGQTAENWNFPDCIAGAGGLKSTGNDMLKFLSANMGSLQTELNPALSHSHTTLFSNKTLEVGMGWHHKPLKPSNEMIIWHNGKTGGFSSFLGFTKDLRFGVVILSNSTRDVGGLAHKILNTLLDKNKIED